MKKKIDRKPLRVAAEKIRPLQQPAAVTGGGPSSKCSLPSGCIAAGCPIVVTG